MQDFMPPLSPRSRNDVRRAPSAAIAVADELVAAFNRHDADDFAACFTSDAWFINVVGHRFTGREEIARAHRFAFDNTLARARLEAVHTTGRALSEEIALLEAVWTSADHRDDPDASDGRRGVLVLVLQRDEHEQWQIAHCTNCDYTSHPYGPA